MASEDTKIRRGLFGMRTADVERLLGDREQAARVAAAQIQAAEERAAAFQERATALEAQLSKAIESREELARKREELAREMETRPAAAPAEPPLPLGVLTQEMARVLNATQEAGSRILARTRSDVEKHLEDIERRRSATEEQRERLASWTGDASASLGGLRDRLVDTHDAIQHMRAAVEQAGNSTRAALSDLERQVAEVTSLLDRFRDVGPAQPAQEAESSDPQVLDVPGPAEHAPEQAVAPEAPAPPVTLPSSPQGSQMPVHDGVEGGNGQPANSEGYGHEAPPVAPAIVGGQSEHAMFGAPGEDSAPVG